MKNKSQILTMIIILIIGIVVGCLTSSCSSEDTETLCDCNITTSKYIESMQTYEPIIIEHYSNNCEDHKPYYNPDGKGNYYMIQCK